MVENEKVRVWYINGNDLKYSSKDIVKTKYNDIEIAVLKEDLKFNYQDFLIKDINNEYWALGIIPIRFENFEKATNNQFSNERKYCDEMLKKLGNMEEIKKFFNKKIKNGKWFNKCEIEYIYRYYPDLYDNAKKCRENIIKQRNAEKIKEKEAERQYKKEVVEKTNSIFKNKLKDIKHKILIGENVSIDNLEFYKDDNYENGKTIQNAILYLAKQYEIEIPLATKGFINNRLVKYNFKTGEFAYKLTNNKRASFKMHQYLRQIFEKVKEENKKELSEKKVKRRMEAR